MGVKVSDSSLRALSQFNLSRDDSLKFFVFFGNSFEEPFQYLDISSIKSSTDLITSEDGPKLNDVPFIEE